MFSELGELGHIPGLRVPDQSVNFWAAADVVVVEHGVELVRADLPIHVVLDLARQFRLVLVDGLVVHDDPVLGRASVEMHVQNLHVRGRASGRRVLRAVALQDFGELG